MSPLPLAASSTIVVARASLFCEVGAEAVILDLAAGTYHGLNSVAARVWHLIQEPRAVHEVQHALLEEFDVAPECCERDLLTLLRDLLAKDLIAIAGESPS